MTHQFVKKANHPQPCVSVFRMIGRQIRSRDCFLSCSWLVSYVRKHLPGHVVRTRSTAGVQRGGIRVVVVSDILSVATPNQVRLTYLVRRSYPFEQNLTVRGPRYSQFSLLVNNGNSEHCYGTSFNIIQQVGRQSAYLNVKALRTISLGKC